MDSVTVRPCIESSDREYLDTADDLLQLLLIAEPDLGGVVDLGPDGGLAVQHVLDAHTETGGVAGVVEGSERDSSWRTTQTLVCLSVRDDQESARNGV